MRSQSSRFSAKSESQERLVTAVNVPKPTHSKEGPFSSIFITPILIVLWLFLGLELAKQLDLPAPAAVGNLTLDCGL